MSRSIPARKIGNLALQIVIRVPVEPGQNMPYKLLFLSPVAQNNPHGLKRVLE